MNTPGTDAKLAELKQRVATGDYVVDPRLAADAMLEKMRLVRTARRQLIEDSEAGLALVARRRSHRRDEALQRGQESHAPARYAA
jgi:hypothetical protein